MKQPIKKYRIELSINIPLTTEGIKKAVEDLKDFSNGLKELKTTHKQII